jgi:chemotaxis protein histidine kinase CheA
MLVEASNEEGFEVVVRRTDYIIEQNDKILDAVRKQEDKRRKEDEKNTQALKSLLDDYEKNQKAREEEAVAREKRREEEAASSELRRQQEDRLRELRLEENAKAREQRLEENAMARELRLEEKARAREQELLGIRIPLIGLLPADTDDSHRRDQKTEDTLACPTSPTTMELAAPTGNPFSTIFATIASVRSL